MTTLIYLLKAAACTLAFYALYRVFLSRLTFFSLNRWYLIITLALSFVLPAVQYTVTKQLPVTDEAFMTDDHDYSTLTTAITTITQQDAGISDINLSQVLLFAYLTVAGILTVKLSVSLIKLLQAKRYSKQYGTYSLVKQDSGLTNCSFFNTIFLKNNLSQAEEQTIIAHETEHIKRLHSADKLLMEIAKIVLWFNPFIYQYKKALDEVHEYEADAALTGKLDKKDYADTLLKLSGFNGPVLVNSFSGSLLNKRVNMLFAGRTAAAKKLFYVLAIPVLALLTWYISINKVYADITPLKSNVFTVLIDAGHGGKDKGTTVNGISEKDLALSYVKEIKRIAAANDINVVLTREADISTPLKDRVKSKADLFISLHFNDATEIPRGVTAFATGPEYNNPSVAFAKACLDELAKVTGITNVNVRGTDKIFVLREAKIPATLLEIGYMANADDLKFISNADNQSKIAQGIVDAIKQYQSNADK